ncbi:YciY family protein [Xenorhabdus beddingii]|uniref:YciY family protein n=1 Tax=Xenorhabdus beddingii TaxID=40578 RepID=UPI000A324ED5|nr:YciY family protein [Xenorhabdus beddingii]
MKHNRNEVGRWRMIRQNVRRRRRWLEDQSRRNFRIYKLHKTGSCKHRRSLLFIQNIEWL